MAINVGDIVLTNCGMSHCPACGLCEVVAVLNDCQITVNCLVPGNHFNKTITYPVDWVTEVLYLGH